MKEENNGIKSVPKDLGLKIGTPEQVFWTGMKEETEKGIKDSEHVIEINEHLLKYIEKRIDEEKKKLK